MQRHSLMAASAAAGATPAPRENRRTTLQRSTNTGIGGYSNGPGWGHAQVKRMAKKRKNQRRNKLAHRRAGA